LLLRDRIVTQPQIAGAELDVVLGWPTHACSQIGRVSIGGIVGPDPRRERTRRKIENLQGQLGDAENDHDRNRGQYRV
jgi:hypothetical protein